MGNSRNILWIIWMFTFCLTLPAQSNRARFEYLGTSETISDKSITCFLQDPKGYMWIGTNIGLFRYDGFSFANISSESYGITTLENCFVRSMILDEEGTLWVGSQEGVLFEYHRNNPVAKAHVISQAEEREHLSEISIQHLLQDTDGVLWVGATEGLFTFDKHLSQFIKYEFPFNLLPINTLKDINIIFEDDKRELWIGTENGLLNWNKITRKGIWYQHELSSSGIQAPVSIISIYQSNQILYVATKTDVFLKPIHESQFSKIFSRSDVNSDSNLSLVSDIQVLTGDNKDHLWIGTFGGGIIRLQLSSGNAQTYLHEDTKPGSLTSNNIISLYLDKAGLLWVGTFTGINTLNLNKINFFLIPENRDHKQKDVYAITKDNEGNLWLATDQGLAVYEWDSLSNTYYSRPLAFFLKKQLIYALYTDKDGNLWAGSEENGVYVLTKEHIHTKTFTFETVSGRDIDLTQSEILTIRGHPKGGVLVGTDAGGFYITLKENEVKQIWNEEMGAELPPVYSLLYDKHGRYWLGTDKGIVCLKERRSGNSSDLMRQVMENDSIEKLVNVIHQDRRGDIWMGTEGQGIFRFQSDNNRFISYGSNELPPDKVIYGILEDQSGHLWMSTSRGLIKIVRSASNNAINIISYNTLNSDLPANEYYPGSFYSGTDNILYFGSSKGVVAFQLDFVARNETPPQVIITDFQLFFEPVLLGKNGKVLRAKDSSIVNSRWIGDTDEIILDFTQNVLYFEFSAMNFVDHQANEYAYRLDEVDSKWNYIKNKNNATFTYLDPGTYTLRVKAANYSGIWNEEGTSLRIKVTPPFYQTPLFYIIICILLVLIVFAFFWNQQKRRKLLERKVQVRTQELFLKKEELEQTLEELKHMQSQLVENEKMASLGQLTAGVAHEINNPITFVTGNVNPLKRDVEDIINILSEYEKIIAEFGLEEKFKRVNQLKNELEYQYVKEEIWELLAGIDEGAKRTSQIVKGLRNFSRLDEDQLKQANVNEGIDSTLLILKSQFKGRIDIKKSYSELPEIICYPGKLNQVYMNILNNAIQAIEDNGTIIIKTFISGPMVCISIRDNGKGMDETVKKRIFEPFFTTKDVGEGTGLGLSITFGIVQDHEGNIEVNTEVGEGTEFVISLPIAGPRNPDHFRTLNSNGEL